MAINRFFTGIRVLLVGCAAMAGGGMVFEARCGAQSLGQPANGEIGSSVPAFQRTDYQGREWKSSELWGKRGTVIAFLGTQCPLAKQYTARLVEMEKAFEDRGIRFVAVDANVQDSLAEMSAHARRFGMSMPFLKDPNQELADALRVTRTPEVCVVDGQGVLRYRGRIDDQFGIGYARERPEAEELREAILAVVEDRPVAISTMPAPGCLIGRVRTRSQRNSTEVNYAEHVAPVLRERCVACHRDGDIGPMDLTTYEDASAWADMIVEVTQDRRMPPWHASEEYGEFSNDRRMKESEIETLRAWAEQGTPRGNPEREPPKLSFAEGWLLPEVPEIVVPMRDRPYSIPAQGEVKYQYFAADLNNEQELWFRGMEVVPGNRAVVHHILVFAREKGKRGGDIAGDRSFLAGYVPGTRAAMMEPGYAKRVAPNTQLIFQIHYTPNGSPQEDLSKVGFVLADPATVTHEVLTSSAVSHRFRIPPGDSNYATQAEIPERLPDCELLAMSPHMHVRGKSFRYTLVFPDKSREVILDIPQYDFNWQTEYRLKEKRRLPAGTRIFCEATFDNSEANLNNPDPSAWVTWGDQTYEEMMIGYFHYAVPR
jgi:peroxiredoxin